jgi:hypothetical protein
MREIDVDEKERRIVRYRPRRRKLAEALERGATRTERAPRSQGDACAICTRTERTGGLLTYRLQDNVEWLLGARCAEYLDYLIASPERARELLRDA